MSPTHSPDVVATPGSDSLLPGDGGAARRSRVASVLLVAAGLLGVLVPLTMAAVTGGLSIPHNDAWSYSRIAQTFGSTGGIELLGWNRSALFGQFIVLGPLARWLVAQHLFVALLGVVALAAVYDLVVPSAGRARAALAVLIVAIWPGFGLLTTSFMLDVPAMAAIMVCLAVGRRALRSGSLVLLAVSMAVGFWGFTIREQALAAPVTVLAVAAATAWRSRRRRDWIVVAGACAILLTVVVGFELWRQSFGAGDPPVLAVPESLAKTGGNILVQGYFVLALGAAPAVLLVARPWRWGRGALLAAAAAAVVAVAAVYRYGTESFFVGNYLDPSGPYWAAGHGRPAAIFPTGVWWLIVALACGSGVLLAGILARQLRRVDPVLGTFSALMVLGNLATALTGQNLFDRYWLLLLPPLLAIVLAERTSGSSEPQRRPAAARVAERLPAAAALAGLAVVSLMITAAGLAYDSARWDAAEDLVATGVPAVDVDAGLEWNGYHSAVGMSPPGSWIFPGNRSCYLVSAVPRPGQDAATVSTYRPLLVAGTARLWVYGDDCP
ncbi:glycosyltransferase family 39 protein [Rhodococcus sp. UNC363MFTsu5.1]|uniref:glycosyltransferase family 39 protein n=1 Tax=Rhodococcus sp. UNC363MFTsu5.1 TaxID=1449069 RepID=UPI0009E09325|nr:glycosyltransferase family 39 protein [Rhodococcus sp. UNC363MFTsu5.1]